MFRMSSEVAPLKVVFNDDKTSQENLVYSGQTMLAPFPKPLGAWLLCGTPIKFCATTACTVTLPNFLEVKEMLQTITAMKVYSDKSIEELRLEDYNVRHIKKPQFPLSSNCTPLFTSGKSAGFYFTRCTTSPSTSTWSSSSTSRSSEKKKAVSVPMSIDSSTEGSEVPLPSISYSFTPNINFISESDPAHVFTAPPDAEPLSALSVSEARQLRDALLESIVKCMQIQNSLYRLVLIKLQQTAADSQCSGPSKVSKVLSTKGTGESQNDAPRALLCELKKPLDALMRCADIQRALFQRLIAVNVITAEEIDPLLLDNQEVQTEAEVNLMTVRSDLEEIAFKNEMECSYARNPFATLQLNASTSKDVIHHISVKGRHFPHGHGNLTTLSGKLVYSGEWRKGKRHGKGEGLILTVPSDLITLNQFADEHGFYTGRWKHNMRHGHGQMTFSSGAVYKGQWQFDKMTGYGTLNFPDGTIQEGTWKEGTLHGCTLFTWPHGVTEYREYDANRGQLSSCKIESETAEKLSQISCVRSQLLTLRDCVIELKDEKRSLTKRLNTQKKEHSEASSEIKSTLVKLKSSFIAQRKKDVRQHQDEYEAKLKEAAETQSKSAERIRELEKQLEESQNTRLCQICFEHPRDCIIMPCTHLLYCRACVAEHKRSGGTRCPTCRGPISGEILCNINHTT